MPIKQRFWIVCALLAVLLSLTLGGWGWIHFFAARHTSPVATTKQQKVARQGTSANSNLLDMASTYLIIPSIGVNAPVESVGVSPTGNMNVPAHNQWEGVGWYQKGPLPGEHGSAVIDGHLDRPGGLPAVFWNLNKIHIGDLVAVADDKGHIHSFRVTKLVDYTPNNAPTASIFANDTGTYLNLITCAGTWVPAQQQTTLRLVVYTTLVH